MEKAKRVMQEKRPSTPLGWYGASLLGNRNAILLRYASEDGKEKRTYLR